MIDNWTLLRNRIESEVAQQLRNNNGNKDQGVVKINITMLMDLCQPIIWQVDGKRIEPSSKAKALLDLL